MYDGSEQHAPPFDATTVLGNRTGPWSTRGMAWQRPGCSSVTGIHRDRDRRILIPARRQRGRR